MNASFNKEMNFFEILSMYKKKSCVQFSFFCFI